MLLQNPQGRGGNPSAKLTRPGSLPSANRQQRCEAGSSVFLRCLAHPRERHRQGDPALRPDLGALVQVPLGLAPSLHAPRFLRRLHRYYEPVRLPVSARNRALVFPRSAPPPATKLADPTGSPGFRRRPFARGTVLDPGGASPSRVSTAHTRPSLKGNSSASAIFKISRLTTRTPCNPCLRFGPRVAATPARLGTGLPATALTGRDSRPHVVFSLSQRTPDLCVKRTHGGQVRDTNRLRRHGT